MIALICTGCYSLKSVDIFYGDDSSENLVVFIGQKEKLNQFDMVDRFGRIDNNSTTGDTINDNGTYFNEGFDAEYRVVDWVYNKLQVSTIEFLVFDHFGEPNFSNYDYVMLYLYWSEDLNSYVLHKYKANKVFKNERFAWVDDSGRPAKALFLREREKLWQGH